MLTPKELYETYSANPCSSSYAFSSDPLNGQLSYGIGTPFYGDRIVRFARHLKKPCYFLNNADIVDTGLGKIGLPFKFLQSLDIEAFHESQPTIKSGTAHAVRNAADIARACMFFASGLTENWVHRGATEYIEHYGSNSLPDCLMTLGPDLIKMTDSAPDSKRAPGVENKNLYTEQSMTCFPYDTWGVMGTTRGCQTPPGENPGPPQCRSCGFCERGEGGVALNPDSPCCKYTEDTPAYVHLCCGAPKGTRLDFAYVTPPVEDASNIDFRLGKTYVVPFDSINDINTYTSDPEYQGMVSELDELLYHLNTNDAIILQDGSVWVFKDIPGTAFTSGLFVQYSYKLRHAGLLERKLYDGYANFINSTGSTMHAISDDIFLQYVQDKNFWDYDTDTFLNDDQQTIYRARTISLLLAAAGGGGQTPVADTQLIVDAIKDLLWNGHGVLMFSNVGFPNTRDAQGVAYPDRIWYTTYTIIGYDDSKIEFNECVYVLSCPWGDWITGGHPSWGPLPPGCFLVTETHLKCMLRYYSDQEYYGCRSRLPCNPVLYDCENPTVIQELSGCNGHGPADKCEPYYCVNKQSAYGLAYAISLSDGFPQQNILHQNYYPVTAFREKFNEQTLYYNYYG